jgi:hypothetical protein
MTTKSKWKPAQYHIATGTAVEPVMILVNGETKGYFGIHGTPFNYTITHIPTGYAINKIIPDGMKRTKKNLRIVIDKISQFDWNFTDPKQAITLKSKAKKLIDQITQDDIK